MVTFGNAGDTAFAQAFDLVLFSDIDEDGLFDRATDTVLGALRHEGGMGAGESVTEAVDVAGEVRFRDDLIYAFVDAWGQSRRSRRIEQHQ